MSDSMTDGRTRGRGRERARRSRRPSLPALLLAAGALLATAITALGTGPTSAAMATTTGAAGTTATVRPVRPIEFGAGVTDPSGTAYAAPVACPSDGSCVTGGSFDQPGGDATWMAASQQGATWADGAELPRPPGIVTVTDGFVGDFGLACGAAGTCIAGGRLTSAGETFATVATMQGGTWVGSSVVGFPTARAVPRDDEIITAECANASLCLAVGGSYALSGDDEAFVVPIVDGTPQLAVLLPAPSGPQVPATPQVYATGIACSSVGECVVVGTVDTIAAEPLGVVWAQHGGVWGAAQLATYPVGFEAAQPSSQFVPTCVPGGACTVTGLVRTTISGSDVHRMTVAPVVDGVLGMGTPVALDPSIVAATHFEGGYSCNPSRCQFFLSAVMSPTEQIPVWFEIVGGVATTITPLPATSSDIAPGVLWAMTMSCTSVGDCVAVGFAEDGDVDHAVYWLMVDGVWSAGAVPEYPSSANAKAGNVGDFWSVACVFGGNSCVASGSYDGAGRTVLGGVGDGPTTTGSVATRTGVGPRIGTSVGASTSTRGVPPSETAVSAMTMQVDFVKPPAPVPPIVPTFAG